ncbi:MAG: D-alanine--D-alanine ligase [Sedimentisphaerales bacterium]|nr:D-alanine--D-alanine ligase [Sedimentisphaerales bacterium]
MELNIPGREGVKNKQGGTIETLRREVVASQSSRQLSILVLRGGPGAEREVSLMSGACVARALRQSGHEVTEADITPDDLSALDIEGMDLVFPVLHGTFGEDGQVQEIMEQRQIRYVGSDAQSSRLAMDKYRAKMVMAIEGILTAPSALIVSGHNDESSSLETQIKNALTEVPIPCVIKPNQQGSSVGVVIVRQEAEVRKAIFECINDYGDCLLEQYIDGPEYTVGIVGREPLPVLEVRPAQEFYDYQAKYEADDTDYVFDLDLPNEVLQNIQDIAFRAFDVLGCRDLARVDLITDSVGRIYVLEVNTIPGFTDHSLVPKAAARIGMNMPALCDHIVQIAWYRPI